VNGTVDPMLDVSLDIGGAGDAANPTLEGCLRRFVGSEKLGGKEYTCGRCKGTGEASKRMSIRKLPPVLCFQFKVCYYSSSFHERD